MNYYIIYHDGSYSSARAYGLRYARALARYIYGTVCVLDDYGYLTPIENGNERTNKI